MLLWAHSSLCLLVVRSCIASHCWVLEWTPMHPTVCCMYRILKHTNARALKPRTVQLSSELPAAMRPTSLPPSNLECLHAQMEGMVTDLQLAREKQQAFEQWQRQNEKTAPLDLSITVLTTGFWPNFKVCAS